MLTLQELAAYVCYYGGSSLQTIQALEEENLRIYGETLEIQYLTKAKKLSVLQHMMNEGVEFEMELTSSRSYYKPKQGWEILNQYLDADDRFDMDRIARYSKQQMLSV